MEVLFKGPLNAVTEAVKCNYVIYWSSDHGMDLVDKWTTEDKINDGNKEAVKLIAVVELKWLFQGTMSLEDFHTKAMRLVTQAGYEGDAKDQVLRDTCYVNTNLYSALEGTPSSYQLHFTIAAAKANHHSVSHQCEREPPSPISTLPGEHTGPHHILCSIPSNNQPHCSPHTYTHSLMVDRSTVVGHVPMVHMCSFMCTNHIDMIAHPSLLTS